jgi:hypothetical protein
MMIALMMMVVVMDMMVARIISLVNNHDHSAKLTMMMMSEIMIEMVIMMIRIMVMTMMISMMISKIMMMIEMMIVVMMMMMINLLSYKKLLSLRSNKSLEILFLTVTSNASLLQFTASMTGDRFVI